MKFYKMFIDEGKKRKFAFGIELSGFNYERHTCSVCNDSWYVDKLSNQLKITLSNSNFPDFLGMGKFLFISERVKEIFADQGIELFQLTQTEVVSAENLTSEQRKELRYSGFSLKKVPENPPGYSLLNITGKADLHPDTNYTVDKCGSCGKVTLRTGDLPYVDSEMLILDQESWDKSELFTIHLFPHLGLCTEKFVELYSKYKLTGLLFSEIETK